MEIDKLFKNIDDYFAECQSNKEVRNLATTLVDYIKEFEEDYTAEHCEETGISIHECKCWECSEKRENYLADRSYDALKVDGYY